MGNNENNPGLIVPVDLKALCVGINDQQAPGGTSSFAGATTTFTDQTGKQDAYLGSNVIRGLNQPPLHQLTAGIHLHWALPEALTRGIYDKASAKLNFAYAPNRWLLSRILVNGADLTRRSWIIESDTLQESVPAGRPYITLAVKKLEATDQNYRYIGRAVEFDAQWTDPGDQSFENLTGNRLTAVSSGDVSFAAFYPNSNNVFGFYDDMSDVTADATTNVMYQITGWFSNPESDPLDGEKSLQDIQDLYGWTFAGEDIRPSYSLYSGLVQNIEWNLNRDYIVDPLQQKPVKATLTVGNNAPETFSAYFKELLENTNPFFEKLLNAFQMGLLNTFKQPAPDQLAQLEAAVYQKQFAGINAGTIYSVEKLSPDEWGMSAKDKKEDPVILPLQLAEALNLLNVFQQQADFLDSYIQQFQWQLYSDWFRLMNADDDTHKNNLSSLLGASVFQEWPQIQQTFAALIKRLQDQLDLVNKQVYAMGPGMHLKANPAPRYWQANEPVVLVTLENGDNLLRHGNTGKDESNYLPCRLKDTLLTAIAVKDSTISSSQFSGMDLAAPNNLPDGPSCDGLLEEACLLNTNVVSALTGIQPVQLEDALLAALGGGAQSLYAFTGLLPADLAVYWWNGNPWMPIMMHWESNYAPLQPTQTSTQLLNYESGFFNSNYRIDQDQGGSLDYIGKADPKTLFSTQDQYYSGTAILSPSAAESFEKQLNQYLDTHTDETLLDIRDILEQGGFLSAALNGFNSALLMQQQDLQLTINVNSNNPFLDITKAVAEIVGQQNTVSPTPSGYFNPIRAGYLQPNLFMVDTYGNKRQVQIDKIVCADSLTTRFNGQQEPGIVYMPARLSQPSRLIFRWLSATGDAIEEMNAHPATTPVCGWVMPNHLNGGLFFYNQQGKALGMLALNGDKTAIIWETTPGDNATINQSIEEVLEYQNPQLAAFALALRYGSPQFYTAFTQAIDSMSNFVNPQNYAQNSDLAVLVGRPIALTQALLRLEVDGGPAVNQSWLSVTKTEFDTDNGASGVSFPVILGDLNQINDGLLGYFLPGDNGYNFSTFYSETAAGSNGVIKPTSTTITLTASPKPGVQDPANPLADAMNVLMLVDPRATIHATMGILPVKTISIPPDQYADTLSILEMTFLTTPVLKGVSGFNMPVPREAGYDWSWVQEVKVQGHEEWLVTPGIGYTASEAIAAYTPQSLNEGWLRLNPQLLIFTLLNSQGQPQASAGIPNTLTLKATNKKPAPLEFTPGQLVNEGTVNSGSVFYLHFGRLVPQDQVPLMNISCDGWQFKSLSDDLYGNYWAATPLDKYTLNAGAYLTMLLTSVITTDLNGQVQICADYYGITGINDGVNAILITVTGDKTQALF